MFQRCKVYLFKNSHRNSHGQVVVEYVLLMIISVTIAALITSQLASRDPENAGILVKKWQQILQTIAEDIPDP